jgi:RNA polymerase sigma factor (TIGR02999 family)
MARRSQGSVPGLRHHKPSGKAVVTLSGQDFYCGTWGTKVALSEYDRHVSEWLIASERRGQTLQPTALVHEAYLRLVPTPSFASRTHFFAAAAEAMRRILVDQARRKSALKHGGPFSRQELLDSDIATAAPPAEVIAVHEALDALAAKDPLTADLVKLRYFGGYSLEEAGELLGMSRATAYRLWTYGRAWLRAELTDGQESA